MKTLNFKEYNEKLKIDAITLSDLDNCRKPIYWVCILPYGRRLKYDMNSIAVLQDGRRSIVLETSELKNLIHDLMYVETLKNGMTREIFNTSDFYVAIEDYDKQEILELLSNIELDERLYKIRPKEIVELGFESVPPLEILEIIDQIEK